MTAELNQMELATGLVGGLALFLFGMDIMTRALKQVAGALAERRLDLGGRHGLVDHQRDVLTCDGIRREVRGRHDVAGAIDQEVEVDLDCGAPRRQAEGDTDTRMELAGVAELGPLEREAGTPTGVPRHPVGRLDGHVDVELLREPADQRDGVGPAGLTACTPPAGALALAAEHRGQELRLLGNGVEQLGQLVVGGTPVDAIDRGRAAVHGESDGADLEQGHALGAPAEVARRRLEQPG